jgi:hypothetical protein
MEGGDWSEVIDKQTQEAVGGPSPPPVPSTSAATDTAAAAAGQSPVISPFTQATVHRTVGEKGATVKALTQETADQALNEVSKAEAKPYRPYGSLAWTEWHG